MTKADLMRQLACGCAAMALAASVGLWGGTRLTYGQAAPPAAEAPSSHPLDGETADKRLKALEEEIGRSQAEQAEIDRKAKAIADELEQIRGEMMRMAKTTQESEDNLSALERTMEELTQSEQDKSEALQRRSQQMTGVLTALQRLAWRPTEALIAQPQSPADTVRSAILLRAAVPQIEFSARNLRHEIDSLTKVRIDIADQRQRIGVMTAQLAEENNRLNDLWLRKATLQSATLEESARAQNRTRQLANEASDLRDLLARLEEERQRQIAEAKAKIEAEKAARLAEKEAAIAAREAAIAAAKAEKEAARAAAKAEKERRTQEIAEAKEAARAETKARAEARSAELEARKAAARAEQAAKDAAAAKPVTFTLAHGRMTPPARGPVVRDFDTVNELGVAVKGITYRTRDAAQVVAPYDGQVVFAESFRGYGLLLIIDHGEGYHSLLAGMERIDATVGQRLLAGEPVGVMGRTGDGEGPGLYVELRRNGQPINPLPWMSAQKGKVSG